MRVRSLMHTVCVCSAMTKMLGMLAIRDSPHVACMRACLHVLCYTRVALRVRDLARVEGLVVGGGGGLAATRVLGLLAMRQ